MRIDTEEWELLECELRKIPLETMRTYLLTHQWELRKQNDNRFELYSSIDEILIMLPVQRKLSDYWYRFYDAVHTLARFEHLWMPYMVIRLIEQGKE